MILHGRARPDTRRSCSTRTRRAGARIALGAALLAAGTGEAAAATRLFIRNHVNSNDIRALAPWDGVLEVATTGGLVTVGMPAGPLTKTLRSPAGLPTNRLLSVVESPSGALWIGTADQGIARRTRDGGWRRPLTSFDGLPTDVVRTLYRRGDSVWVGTSGGAALFTENPANGQVSLRRSDSQASTAGALVSDDVRAFAQLGDTIWVGTAAGLSSFTAAGWQDRRAVYASGVEALLAVGDTLWVGTATGPRAYAGGILAGFDPAFVGTALSIAARGDTVYAGSNGTGVYRRVGGGWIPTGPGLPVGKTQALGIAPDGALWAGTETGLARYAPEADAWTAYRTQGPVIDDFESERVAPKAAVGGGYAWFTPGNKIAPGGGPGLVLRTDGTLWSELTSSGTLGALQPTSVFGILADRSDRMWFGHCCSDQPPRPRVERFDPATNTWLVPGPTNVITFGEAPGGRVYGGTAELGNGIYEFDAASGAVLDSLTPSNTQGSAVGSGLTDVDIRAVAFDATGAGWIGLYDRGLDRWDGRGTPEHADDIWRHFATGFPSPNVTSLAVLDPTLVYIGTEAGIAVLRNEIIDIDRKNAINAAIGGASVQDLARDPRRVVWIATNAGLARLDDATGVIERFTTADGLADNDVRGLAWDEERGILWAATAHGFSEIHPQGGGAPAFDAGAYVYPNPILPGSGALRIGALTGAVVGEIRDAAGRWIRNFRADPSSDAIWDLRDAAGETVAPGIYLVVLRDGERTRILRVAVVR